MEENNKNQPQWEEEFDRVFPPVPEGSYIHNPEKMLNEICNRIKSFISKVEQQAIQRERDRVVEILEEMYDGHLVPTPLHKALKDAIQAIKEEKHTHSFGRDAVTGVYVCMECGMESAYKP